MENKRNFEIESMNEEVEEMTSFRNITAENAVFTQTEGGFLSLDYDGQHWDRVNLIRLFPFTEPDKFISVRTAEERSREIGVIEDLHAMPEETVKLIEKQLTLHYFTPIIKKVIDIKDEYGYAYFHVMTDRGECRFIINMGGNAVVRLTDSRLLISDIDENRFEIPDVFALSQKEQRKLDLFL